MNVLGATQKTFIHEFAHAMSHAENGAIVDEYYDEGVLFLDSSGKPEKGKKPISTMFSVNRLNKSAGTVPVPKIFCNYHESSAEKFVYASDRNHPSAQENWSGFYPERKESDVYCTMDRRYGRYQFDKLIADYMYDRLLHKII